MCILYDSISKYVKKTISQCILYFAQYLFNTVFNVVSKEIGR